METKLTDESVLNWGDHAGKKLGEIPDEWLLGLFNSGKCFGPIKVYIGENLDAIQLNVDRQRELNKKYGKK